jgi:ATP-binding cassette subfamily C (CFTR/MRP) protein 1
MLKHKTVILVTHQLQYLPYLDSIVCLSSNGTISEQGSYGDLVANGLDFARLVDIHAGGLKEKGKQEHDEDEEDAEIAAHEQAVMELRKKISSSGGVKSAVANKEREGEGANPGASGEKGANAANAAGPATGKGALIEKEERDVGAVKLKMYYYYAKASGSLILVGIILAGYILAQVTRIGTDWWIAIWSNDTYQQKLIFYLSIYISWCLANATILFITSLIVAFVAIRCARKLHQDLFGHILNAPLHFFETTPIGRILNRFSKDQDSVDVDLPDNLSGYISIFCICTGSLLVVIWVTPWTLIGILPMLYIYYRVQLYYRASSRELKRLDSISKSPIFAHFSETLGGLTTIRAYDAESRFIDDNFVKLDTNQQAYFTMISANRWLGVRLEILSAVVVFMAALFAVIGKKHIDPSMAGLALSYAFSTTGWMSWFVRSTAEVEQKMNSVERILHYTHNVEQEAAIIVRPSDQSEGAPLPQEGEKWPKEGTIEFRDVVLHYRKDLQKPALQGVSLKIRGGEKVGVCGRTGAGKSSLLVAAFRLVELSGGAVLIDGVDISALPLSQLRSSLAIIPQDPVLFSGTVRPPHLEACRVSI